MQEGGEGSRRSPGACARLPLSLRQGEKDMLYPSWAWKYTLFSLWLRPDNVVNHGGLPAGVSLDVTSSRWTHEHHALLDIRQRIPTSVISCLPASVQWLCYSSWSFLSVTPRQGWPQTFSGQVGVAWVLSCMFLLRLQLQARSFI